MKIYLHEPAISGMRETIEQEFPDTEWTNTIKDAEVVIGNPPYEKISEAKELRLLQLRSAGTGRYAEFYQSHPGIQICCATGAYGHAVAEHMFAALLTMMKRLDGYARNTKTHLFKDLGSSSSLLGAEVLVLGFGNIGSEFGRMCFHMGAHVTGIRRTSGPKPTFAEAVYTVERLDEFLPKADVVALALPETGETRQILNEKRLLSMKKSAYLLNVGRGSAIDTMALYRTLVSGHLAGAFLDVTNPEPLPESHPLWDAPRLLLSPHTAGGDHLAEIGKNVIGITLRNLHALSDGTPFESSVDPITTYAAQK